MEFFEKIRPGSVPDRNSISTLFNNETKALKLLEESFINEPKIDHYPFPKLIKATEYSDYYSITMTNCGVDARVNAKLVESQKNIQPVNLYNTVECIINNLRNTRMLHNDIKSVNVCINKNGQVSLVDFNRARIVSTDVAEAYYKKVTLASEKFAWYLMLAKNPWSILYYF